MSAQETSQVFLTRQTFVAMTSDTLVFLDLHRDKYSCLERRHAKPVARLLGLPVSPEQNNAPDGRADGEGVKAADAVIADLIDRGLITRKREEGKTAEFVHQSDAIREMPGYMPGEGPKAGLYDIACFFKAMLVTKALLRFASMESIVTRVRRRKLRCRAKAGAPHDDERLNELVELYKILKPLVVTVKDQCLYNSLFLIEFLACYRVYPDWYFGVRLNEFYAHCWVQDQGVIYDDSITATGANQPIMVV